jgi:hypothetical protein
MSAQPAEITSGNRSKNHQGYLSNFIKHTPQSTSTALLAAPSSKYYVFVELSIMLCVLELSFEEDRTPEDA